MTSIEQLIKDAANLYVNLQPFLQHNHWPRAISHSFGFVSMRDVVAMVTGNANDLYSLLQNNPEWEKRYTIQLTIDKKCFGTHFCTGIVCGLSSLEY